MFDPQYFLKKASPTVERKEQQVSLCQKAKSFRGTGYISLGSKSHYKLNPSLLSTHCAVKNVLNDLKWCRPRLVLRNQLSWPSSSQSYLTSQGTFQNNHILDMFPIYKFCSRWQFGAGCLEMPPLYLAAYVNIGKIIWANITNKQECGGNVSVLAHIVLLLEY